MDRFEQDLRAGLRRKQAPPDLAAKVLARIEAGQEKHHWWRAPALARAVAIVLVVVAVGIWVEQRHRERVAGEQARHQVELALRIAGSKLQLAEAKVQQLSDRTQE